MECDPIPGPSAPGVFRALTGPSAAMSQLASSASPREGQSNNKNEASADESVEAIVPMAASQHVACRGQKRARRSATDELVGNTTSARVCPLPPTRKEADGYTLVVHKAERKKLLKEEAALEKLKSELASSSKGVFKVTLRRKPTCAEEAVAGFSAGSLMSIFKEQHNMLPACSLGGGTDGICLWAPTVEEAQKALRISIVAGIPVQALCSSFSSFRARIDQVSMAFTVEEIVAELTPVGVVTAQKVPYIGKEGKPTQLGRVRLLFSQPPPTSVFLGYRTHAVTMEVEKPLICFNCQRLGHHSSRCSWPRACRQCGGQGHLAANCSNRPHCVNCRGPHAAGSGECPRIAFAAEKNRLMMEARVLQQVRISAPSAFINGGNPEVRPSGVSESSSPAQPTMARTYASVVRSIAVAENGEPAPAVLLPKPRTIPKKRRSTHHASTKLRRGISRKSKRRNMAKGPAKAKAKGTAGLSAVAALLHGFTPELAAALAALVKQLKPLLALVRLLQGDRRSPTKTHNGQRRTAN